MTTEVLDPACTVLLLFDLYVFETWRWTEPGELPVAEYDLFE